jgi:hypothetical protein
MRFLSIYKARETNVPPTTEEMARMGKLIEEMTNAGVLLATEGQRVHAPAQRTRGARASQDGREPVVRWRNVSE